MLKCEQESITYRDNNACFNRLSKNKKKSFISTGNISQQTALITPCQADCRPNIGVTKLSAAGP